MRERPLAEGMIQIAQDAAEGPGVPAIPRLEILVEALRKSARCVQ
jgi:hypothetical protein